jgi:hypothetical protein
MACVWRWSASGVVRRGGLPDSADLIPNKFPDLGILGNRNPEPHTEANAAAGQRRGASPPLCEVSITSRKH